MPLVRGGLEVYLAGVAGSCRVLRRRKRPQTSNGEGWKGLARPAAQPSVVTAQLTVIAPAPVIGRTCRTESASAHNQAQSDLLRFFKKLVSTAPLRPTMYHVYAHQDRNLRFDQLDVHEQTNVLADNLASGDLRCVVILGDSRY